MIRRILQRIRDYFLAAPPYREPSLGAGRMVRLMERRLGEIEGGHSPIRAERTDRNAYRS